MQRMTCFSDLERSLGIATTTSPLPCGSSPSFSDLERSLGIATLPSAPDPTLIKQSFSDLERSLGIATFPESLAGCTHYVFQ